MFGCRNHMLVLGDFGARAKKVTIFRSTADDEDYGPIDFDQSETKEIELRRLYRILKSELLKIRARCEDQVGRRYTGEVELGPSTRAIRVFKTVPVEGARS